MSAAIEASCFTRASGSKRFRPFRLPARGERLIIEPVDLVADKGEILCVSGDVGAGKSVLLKLLSAQTLPSDGYVRVQGFDSKTQTRAAQRLVSYVAPSTSMLRHGGEGSSLIAALARTDDKRARAERAVEIVGLGSVLDRSPATYSSIERQRFDIVLAVLSTPIVVIDDLFCEASDPSASRIAELLTTYARIWGGAVIFSTNAIEMARGLADSVLVLSEGRTVFYGPPDKILNERLPTSFSVTFLGESGVAMASKAHSNGNGNDNGSALAAVDNFATNVVVEGESKFLALFRDILRPSS